MTNPSEPIRPPGTHSRRERLWWVAGAVLLAALTGVGVYVFTRPNQANKPDSTPNNVENPQPNNPASPVTLADSTKQLLKSLPHTVIGDVVLPSGDEPGATELRQFLLACQEASDGRFKVKFLSPLANKVEIKELREQYPGFDHAVARDGVGILLTVAELNRHAVVAIADVLEVKGKEATINGEARFARELKFVTTIPKKQIVYFTQSNGELSLEEQPDHPKTQQLAQLKRFLERTNLEIRPLTFAAESPAVPDDAAAVVIVEPRTPFSQPAVAALDKYLNTPRGDKKGKLIVLAGAYFGPDRKVPKIGLEEMLVKFNVRLGDRLVMGVPTQELDANVQGVTFQLAAIRARHPVALAFSGNIVFVAPHWRPVSPIRGGETLYRVVPLLGSLPERATWLEESLPRDLNKVTDELNTNSSVRAAKQLTDSPRSLGVVVSEGDVGRAAVIGSGIMFSDAAVRQAQRGQPPVQFEVVGALLDWLTRPEELDLDPKKKP